MEVDSIEFYMTNVVMRDNYRIITLDGKKVLFMEMAPDLFHYHPSMLDYPRYFKEDYDYVLTYSMQTNCAFGFYATAINNVEMHSMTLIADLFLNRSIDRSLEYSHDRAGWKMATLDALDVIRACYAGDLMIRV